MSSKRRITCLFSRSVLLASLTAVICPVAVAEGQRFRVQVAEDGVYQVHYEDLHKAGLTAPFPSERLTVENRGKAVAVHVDDGGDRTFGPGDSLTFVGSHLRGETSHYLEDSPFNVYVLATDSDGTSRRMDGASPTPSARSGPAVKLSQTIHLERDLLRVPLSGPTGFYGDETLWYWMQLNHLASEPTRVPIDISHMDTEAGSTFSLKVKFLGWSEGSNAPDLADHSVEISLNGTPIGRGEWSGRETHRVDMPAIPASLVQPEDNEIGIRVRARRDGENGDPVIDVVYLDWIEAQFPRDRLVADQQQLLQLDAGTEDRLLRLMQPRPDDAWEQVHFFGENGFLATARRKEAEPGSAAGQHAYELSVPEDHRELWVVPDARFRQPSVIELDHPSNLAEATDQTDYFIIAHGSLVEAVAPLADFHRKRGMRTELIDVQDVYDEFNFGIEHPRAIRDFLAHALRSRDAPAPGHVLLVGDADWYADRHADAGGGESNKGSGRIPTWQLRTRDGPAASDHPFVTLSGNTADPALAIGRLPTSTASGVRSMVEKTIAYMTRPPPGDWRSRVLLVSDRENNLSARNQRLKQLAEENGLAATELLSSPDQSGEQHQRQLQEQIDEGMLVLHFFGHGGRFMWQTAPSRGGDTSNLFDMEDLDRLEPGERLPIVLSMSCNTGPFDHPAADSLAEKFLRLQGRGAVAVLAASARNSPSLKFTDTVMEGIFQEASLGEAIRLAKRLRQHPDAALLYNLFGDPALAPALP